MIKKLLIKNFTFVQIQMTEEHLMGKKKFEDFK